MKSDVRIHASGYVAATRKKDCTNRVDTKRNTWKIGTEAAARAESLGISPYEIPDIIGDAINKLVSYEKVQSLFKKG